MGRIKPLNAPRLEILLDSECLYLKGTGPDIEPALLSGHVALYLAETTSVKEVGLQFIGKAKLPPNEPYAMNLSNLS